MKKLLVLSLCFGLFISNQATAQATKEVKAEKRYTEKQVRERASRQARREARKLEKEGWKNMAGAPTIAKQLDLAWEKQYEIDETGYPKWIIANAKVTGGNYSAAKTQAENMAKVSLAGLIESQIASLAELSVANNELDKGEAASVSEAVQASKVIIANSLGRVLTILEVSKTNPNKNVEVQIRIAYNTKTAMEAARQVIVKELKKKTAVTHEKLEKMMGMDKLMNMKSNSNVEEED